MSINEYTAVSQEITEQIIEVSDYSMYLSSLEAILNIFTFTLDLSSIL